MMSNDKIQAVGVNIAEKVTMIWNVADMLRGPFKPHEYGLVILPMTVVKRFHDCLLPTHEAVLAQYEKVKKLAVIDGFLTKASGYQFYNTSKFTFEKLLADPDNIEANFRDYLAGFSPNVQDVLSKFDFDNIIRRMVECNSLYLVIKEFNSPKGYLGPDKISAVDCGYIFEDLVKRFSESFGEEAGAHFTAGVIELIAGGTGQKAVDNRQLLNLFILLDHRIVGGQQAVVKPLDHRHRQDHITVLAAHINITQAVICDTPYKTNYLIMHLIVHISSFPFSL